MDFAARTVGGSRFLGTIGVGLAAFDERLELIDNVVEREGLGVEFLGGGGAFFGGCGGGLRGGIHVGDRRENLGDALILFVGGGGDFADEVVDAARADGDLAEVFVDLAADGDAVFALGNGVLDFFGGLFGSGGGALGESADLVGDDSETGAGFAGTGGFDGGVER